MIGALLHIIKKRGARSQGAMSVQVRQLSARWRGQGIRGGDALTRSSAFLFALAQVQVDPLVWGGQATPDPRRWPVGRVARPIGGGPMHSPVMASTGRAPASLVTYGSFSGPRYYRPWSAPGGGAVVQQGEGQFVRRVRGGS